MRFLIDECLHISLIEVANEHGYEGQHVVYFGLTSRPDHEIVRYAVGHDFVFVTNNAADFQRLYAKEQLHPGLVMIMPVVKPPVQQKLFLAALDAIRDSEPINMMVEVTIAGGRPRVSFLRWPPISRL